MFLIFNTINQFEFKFLFSIFVFIIVFSIGIFLVFNILKFIFTYFYESNKNNNVNQIKNTKKFDSNLIELKRAMQEINFIVNGGDDDDNDDDKKKKLKKEKLENNESNKISENDDFSNCEFDKNSQKLSNSDANSKTSVKSEKVPEKWELRWFLTGCAVSAFLIIFFPPRGGWRFFGLNFFFIYLLKLFIFDKMLSYLIITENASSCRIITIGTNFEPVKWLVFIGFVFVLIVVIVKLFDWLFHKVDTTRKPGILVDKNGKPLKYGPSSPTPPDYVEEDDDERERRQKITAKLIAGAIVLAYFISVIFDVFSK